MARKKRSEKVVMRAVAVEPRPAAPPAPAEVKETLNALCPVCGRAIPESRAVRVQGVKVGEIGYFEAITWDPDKPFGVALVAMGKGSFKEWRYITPEDAPDLFADLKARLVAAVSEWHAKGWIAAADIEALRTPPT